MKIWFFAFSHRIKYHTGLLLLCGSLLSTTHALADFQSSKLAIINAGFVESPYRKTSSDGYLGDVCPSTTNLKFLENKSQSQFASVDFALTTFKEVNGPAESSYYFSDEAGDCLQQITTQLLDLNSTHPKLDITIVETPQSGTPANKCEVGTRHVTLTKQVTTLRLESNLGSCTYSPANLCGEDNDLNINVDPGFTEYNLHYTNDHYVTNMSSGQVTVNGPILVSNVMKNEIKALYGNIFQIPTVQFQLEQQVADSTFVFEKLDLRTWTGTAFFVGSSTNSIVLTAGHNIFGDNFSSEPTVPSNCGNFQIKTRKGWTYQCSSILACSSYKPDVLKSDFCLMEVVPVNGAPPLYQGRTPLPLLTSSLSPNSSLKITSVGSPVGLSSTRCVQGHCKGALPGLFSMGSLLGSVGLGITDAPSQYYDNSSLFGHHAPTMGGNSGGPLVRPDGVVIGIVQGSPPASQLQIGMRSSKILQMIQQLNPSAYSRISIHTGP